MKFIKSISLTLLILFTALQPVAYADCCAHMPEEPAACCKVKLKHGVNHGHQQKTESNSCHEKPNKTPDGKPVFSCCKHIPLSAPNYTPNEARVSQKPVEQAFDHLIFAPLTSPEVRRTYNTGSRSGFGSIQSTPIWLMLLNFRC